MKNNISNKVHEQIQKSYKLMKKRGYDLGLLEEIITKLSQGIHLKTNIKIICRQEIFPDIMSAILNQIGS